MKDKLVCILHWHAIGTNTKKLVGKEQKCDDSLVENINYRHKRDIARKKVLSPLRKKRKSKDYFKVFENEDTLCLDKF